MLIEIMQNNFKKLHVSKIAKKRRARSKKFSLLRKSRTAMRLNKYQSVVRNSTKGRGKKKKKRNRQKEKKGKQTKRKKRETDKTKKVAKLI